MYKLHYHLTESSDERNKVIQIGDPECVHTLLQTFCNLRLQVAAITIRIEETAGWPDRMVNALQR
jgi:hypothetical protein